MVADDFKDVVASGVGGGYVDDDNNNDDFSRQAHQSQLGKAETETTGVRSANDDIL